MFLVFVWSAAGRPAALLELRILAALNEGDLAAWGIGRLHVGGGWYVSLF